MQILSFPGVWILHVLLTCGGRELRQENRPSPFIKIHPFTHAHSSSGQQAESKCPKTEILVLPQFPRPACPRLLGPQEPCPPPLWGWMSPEPGMGTFSVST